MTSPVPLNFLVISTILLGMINLVVPFFTKEDSKIRNFLLMSVSGVFLINIILIDYLYINLIEIKLTGILKFNLKNSQKINSIQF